MKKRTCNKCKALNETMKNNVFCELGFPIWTTIIGYSFEFKKYSPCVTCNKPVTFKQYAREREQHGLKNE